MGSVYMYHSSIHTQTQAGSVCMCVCVISTIMRSWEWNDLGEGRQGREGDKDEETRKRGIESGKRQREDEKR